MDDSQCTQQPVDVSFAIDMSGSVCTPASSSSPKSCNNCPSECRVWSLDQDTCCQNFLDEQVFTKSIIDAVRDANGQAQFSVVSFATNPKIETLLASASDAITKTKRMGWITPAAGLQPAKQFSTVTEL